MLCWGIACLRSRRRSLWQKVQTCLERMASVKGSSFPGEHPLSASILRALNQRGKVAGCSMPVPDMPGEALHEDPWLGVLLLAPATCRRCWPSDRIGVTLQSGTEGAGAALLLPPDPGWHGGTRAGGAAVGTVLAMLALPAPPGTPRPGPGTGEQWGWAGAQLHPGT